MSRSASAAFDALTRLVIVDMPSRQAIDYPDGADAALVAWWRRLWSDDLSDGWLLASALAEPGSRSSGSTAEGWTALLAMARAEQLIGTLATRVAGLPMPDATSQADAGRRARRPPNRVACAALWEAEAARRALAALDVPGRAAEGHRVRRRGAGGGAGALDRRPRYPGAARKRSTRSRRRCSPRDGSG